MFALQKIPYAMNTKFSRIDGRLTNIHHSGNTEV